MTAFESRTSLNEGRLRLRSAPHAKVGSQLIPVPQAACE